MLCPGQPGLCLAVLPAMRRVRSAFPDVHVAAIIDDTDCGNSVDSSSRALVSQAHYT
jgi:hypothetical protein